MFRLATVFLYLSLFLTVSCQQQKAFDSVVEEIFPAVPIKYVALYRVNSLPVSPVFFQDQWSIVIFGQAVCDESCKQRLSLVNEVEGAQKLYVIDGLADHSKMSELASLYPNVAITMGATASSFDSFYAQFDVDTVASSQKNQHVYLVNPAAMLAFSLPLTDLTADVLSREIKQLKSSSEANG